MAPTPPVVLIGAPGAGKTKIGKRVARLLGVDFVDTDRVVVAEHGPIDEIFVDHGEPHFRRLERRAVEAALHRDAVVSLGGGAVLDPDTQAELAALTVVQLTVSAEAVAERIDSDKRPLLRDGGVDAWQRLVEARRPVYERLATRSWDTSSRSLDEIAAEIAAWLKAAPHD